MRGNGIDYRFSRMAQPLTQLPGNDVGLFCREITRAECGQIGLASDVQFRQCRLWLQLLTAPPWLPSCQLIQGTARQRGPPRIANLAAMSGATAEKASL